ncbi:MAG: hypothetical protein WA139_03845 [Candidatus Aenigmatarchaeota archaeon]
MSDKNAILEFSENQEKKADMHSELAERVKRFAEIEPGTVIIIDNFLSPSSIRKCGAPDNTVIGNYKNVFLEEVVFGGSSDTEPSGNDIGVAVEFEKKCKILKFGGEEYSLPDRLKEREFYKKAKTEFVDNLAMRGNLHYNSFVFDVRNGEEDRNFANQYIETKYNTSLEEAGF